MVGFVNNPVLLRVAPVVVSGPKGERKIFALFDEGSTVTLLDEEVAKEIGARGRIDPLRLAWTNGSTQEEALSRRVKIDVRGCPGDEIFHLDHVRTVKDLNLRKQSIDTKKMASHWKHLLGIEVESMTNARPMLLLGQDNIDLIMPREIREGSKNAPVATRTKLGWLIHGNSGQFRGRSDGELTYNCFQQEDDTLNRLVRESFSLDSMGIRAPTGKLSSDADKRARQIMDATTRRDGNAWETGLLWKRDDVILPQSKSMAMNRLRNIERHMDKDEEFAKLYCQKMDEYLGKDYARILTQEEASARDPKTWYLPHFDVSNPNKPGKLRLVFDAAAKSRGTCLNDNLLSGPDLYGNILAILFQFRQHEVAVCGDIKEMFHQIRIRKEDAAAQRFLFRWMDRKREPDVLEMKVMMFGATCSPASAQDIRNRNALEYITKFPVATEAIVERHYMDDYLDSVKTEDEATQLVRDVSEVHRRGGFLMCNWLSNSRSVLETVPEELRATNYRNMDMDNSSVLERVLGLFWDPVEDVFRFKTSFSKVDPELLNAERSPTKREILRIVMSIYDPLGLIGHFVIKAKIIIQDVWRSGIGWDDELPGSLLEKWWRWTSELQDLERVSIPRWYGGSVVYSRGNVGYSALQLHVFCDASEQAFAAVAYLRYPVGEEWTAAFVASKSRVAPLKPTSIPRLEFQAALMAARLGRSISEFHKIKFQSTHYWSDSKTVLCWIKSRDPRRFLPFVAHRIGEIMELTELDQWRWLSTRNNVADEATRVKHPTGLKPGSRWYSGPDFLRLEEHLWPGHHAPETMDVDQEGLELKRVFVGVITEQLNESLPDVRRFSSYLRLVRTTAWVLRFVSNLGHPRADRRGGELNPEEIASAERSWFKCVQETCFLEELKCVQEGRELQRSSRLLQHKPGLDEFQVLRRVGRLPIAQETRHGVGFPVILDAVHPFTRLLLQHYHEKAGHHGQETVANEVRQRFWMPALRRAVRSTWNHCQRCKVDRTRPTIPEMGALPMCRVTIPERPFTVVGLDYFGPMQVRVGRKNEKRYGALFTCMACRAVHLEIASSLTTDSAIMAIRRFASRRGLPKEIWSDNGRNLRGADVELRKAIAELDRDRLESEMTTRGIKWTFMPPAAPHMGGVWERLVRSVKVALGAVLSQRTPTEEVLHTLMSEAEAIVNSRPLTHVSVDADDPEALTPNHFLLGTSSILQAPGTFTDSDLRGRKQWKTAQRLADSFWQRWLREYLPTLSRRGKWTEKARPLREGDLVIIADTNHERSSWPRGVISKVFPGRDGQVRVVDVWTSTGTYRRPVAKICLLDVDRKIDDDLQ